MALDVRDRIAKPTEAERRLIEAFDALPSNSLRSEAFDSFARTGLPHRRLEDWKWTDIRAATDAKTVSMPLGSESLPVPDQAAVLRFDGSSWTSPEDPPEGLAFGKAPRLAISPLVLREPMAALAASFSGEGGTTDVLTIELRAGQQASVYLGYDAGAIERSFSRLRITVGEEASLEIVEQHAGQSALSTDLIEITADKGARIDRTILQEGSPEQVVAVTSNVYVAEGAEYTQTILSFGARSCRLETHLFYEGANAASELNSAYLVADGYHADITTRIEHGAEHCITRQLTKGAVAKGGRGIFQGKFLVPRSTGQFTDADMQHHALPLEDGAEVFAKPELEIYADDVECAHGNTSGQLDETALFYMRQRGIPKSEARALLTEAFILEALEGASHQIKDELNTRVTDFLRNKV